MTSQTQSSLIPEGRPQAARGKKTAIAPVLTLTDGKPTCLSTDVAQHFGKRHDHVLRDIENLLPQLSAEHAPNFGEMSITVDIGNGATRESKAYRLTRDGFTLLAMGFTGKRALGFKLAYIEAFNRMEDALRKGAQWALPDSERVWQVAHMHGQLQQKLLQEVILPCMVGACSVGQRWVGDIGPER